MTPPRWRRRELERAVGDDESRREPSQVWYLGRVELRVTRVAVGRSTPGDLVEPVHLSTVDRCLLA